MILVTEKEIEKAKFEWTYKDGTNFTALLFQLIMKSDTNNFFKLASQYAGECYVVATFWENQSLLNSFKIVEE
ncbi:hypothetical protein [Bacillus nitratireducens]|uniref:hypothetical protein n=1 Tax=Bacillus nitratireducens TaxID=2026193 RepID=UPI0011A5C3B8|nr:hypothetical protein [Bacillus nitratireducens]